MAFLCLNELVSALAVAVDHDSADECLNSEQATDECELAIRAHPVEALSVVVKNILEVFSSNLIHLLNDHGLLPTSIAACGS